MKKAKSLHQEKGIAHVFGEIHSKLFHEFRRWDTCPGPTESRLVGCWTESIWTLKSKIKYVDTENQIAGLLTKGNFTRDESNHLLRAFNIMSFFDVLLQPFQSNQHSKRIRQEEKLGEKERAVAKSKTMMSLVSKLANHPPTTLGSSASNSPGTLGGQHSNSVRVGKVRLVAKGSNENIASNSQVWHSHSNTITSTGRPTKNSIGTRLSLQSMWAS